MIAFASQIGATGLYLTFVWLISAAAGAWMSERKGYGDRVGLAFGLLLTAVGFLIVLLLPGRPGSTWKREGAIPPSVKARFGRGGSPLPPAGEGPAPGGGAVGGGEPPSTPGGPGGPSA